TPDQTMVMTTASSWISTWLPMLKSSAPVPPSEGAANTPVRMAPTMPPRPCTPNTSSESSAPSRRLSPVTPQKHRTPEASPMTMAPLTPTEPQAGVIATRPATAPEAAPSIDALPRSTASMADQDNTAAAVAISVLMKARVAPEVASRLEPALKPNQ